MRRRAMGAAHAALLILMVAMAMAAASQAQTPQTPQNNPPESPGQAPGKELPNAPDATRKDETTGPVQQVQDQTKKAKHMATEELLRARNWEATWISGVYLSKHQELLPLTRKQREEIYLRQTFTTPETYMKRMFEAGIDQARGVPSQWDDGWAGYAERFASREGQFFAANSLAALGNAKLGYEVRYDQCKCRRTWPRIRHAIVRNFLTYDRSEERRHPQWALYSGAFAGGMISTAWRPSPKNAWANGGWAVLGQAGYGTLLNLVIEFSREINEKQGVK